MNIEQMKQTWSELNQKLDDQTLLNEKLIIKMTGEQTKSRLNKIIYYEILGNAALFCLLLYIVPRFDRLDTVVTQVGGIGTIIIAIVCFILSAILFVKMLKIDIQKSTLVQALKAVTELKSYYYKYRIAGWVIGLLIACCVVPVIVKLYHHKDIVTEFSHFIIPILIGLIIGFSLMYLIYKRLYEKNIFEVDAMLKELKND